MSDFSHFQMRDTALESVQIDVQEDNPVESDLRATIVGTHTIGEILVRPPSILTLSSTKYLWRLPMKDVQYYAALIGLRSLTTSWLRIAFP